VLYTADSGLTELIPPPTVGRVPYTFIRLVTLECTRAVNGRYTTADIVLDIGCHRGIKGICLHTVLRWAIYIFSCC